MRSISTFEEGARGWRLRSVRYSQIHLEVNRLLRNSYASIHSALLTHGASISDLEDEILSWIGLVDRRAGRWPLSLRFSYPYAARHRRRRLLANLVALLASYRAAAVRPICLEDQASHRSRVHRPAGHLVRSTHPATPHQATLPTRRIPLRPKIRPSQSRPTQRFPQRNSCR